MDAPLREGDAPKGRGENATLGSNASSARFLALADAMAAIVKRKPRDGKPFFLFGSSVMHLGSRSPPGALRHPPPEGHQCRLSLNSEDSAPQD